MQCVVLVVASVVGCFCVCSTLTLTVRERGVSQRSTEASHQQLSLCRLHVPVKFSAPQQPTPGYNRTGVLQKNMVRAVFMSHPRALIVEAGARM